MNNDLRSDLIVQAHDYSLHTKWAEMEAWIKQFAMWQSLQADIRQHIKTCLLCLSKVTARRVAVIELVVVAAYRHNGFVHMVLPRWLADIIGCSFPLTVNCLASGEIEIVSVLSVGAQCTTVALFLHWIKIRGFFRTATTATAGQQQ